MQIPVIDLQASGVADHIRAAAMASGFFYVRNHGVPRALIEAQMAMAQRFFDLPQPDKDRLSLRYSRAMRGYEAMGEQTLDAAARPDLKESFYCGIPCDEQHPYVQKGYTAYGANQWPTQLPEMANQCQAYIQAMLALVQRLMLQLAVSLDEPQNTFHSAHGYPMVTLRLLRYPPQPPDAPADTFGAGAHTDWGAMTLLAQDAHGGLEVYMADGQGGQWVPAPPIADTLVVNLGDMIPRWTNGLYRSNPHRVRNLHSQGQPRYSIPFFYSPDHEMRVQPLARCVPAGEAPRYTACTAGQHLQEMYRKTYGELVKA